MILSKHFYLEPVRQVPKKAMDCENHWYQSISFKFLLTGKSNPIIIQTRKAPAAMLGRNSLFVTNFHEACAEGLFENHAMKE
jgi:hypothetical protein